MNGSQRLSQTSSPAAPLLPPEVWLVLPIAPLPAALLLEKNFLGMTHAQQLLTLAAMAVPFVAIGLTLQALYRWVVPLVLRRLRNSLSRGAVHGAVILIAPAAIGLLVRPLYNRLSVESVSASYGAVTSVLLSAIVMFPAMLLQRHRHRAEDSERLAMAERQAALRARFDALQARTSPHFFFNSINTVASLIQDDPVLAERTLERLADLFRYALDSAEKKSVPLQNEFDHIADYLAIQAVRFGPRLESSLSLDPALADLRVPPLLLQPLVENAILHGLSTRKSGRISIVARCDGHRAIIEVSDDGPGPGASAHRGNGTSMQDLSERLRLAFGDEAIFTLGPAAPGGCCARVAIPLVAPG
jgi:two-component system, LytTR family, sensor histidine kinase AlgZ